MQKTSKEYKRWSRLTYYDSAVNIPFESAEFKHALEQFPIAEFERNKSTVEATTGAGQSYLGKHHHIIVSKPTVEALYANADHWVHLIRS